jgi:hypothetical protein
LATVDLKRGPRWHRADDDRPSGLHDGVSIRSLSLGGNGGGGDSDRLQKEAPRDVTLWR